MLDDLALGEKIQRITPTNQAAQLTVVKPLGVRAQSAHPGHAFSPVIVVSPLPKQPEC